MRLISPPSLAAIAALVAVAFASAGYWTGEPYAGADAARALFFVESVSATLLGTDHPGTYPPPLTRRFAEAERMLSGSPWRFSWGGLAPAVVARLVTGAGAGVVVIASAVVFMLVLVYAAASIAFAAGGRGAALVAAVTLMWAPPALASTYDLTGWLPVMAMAMLVAHRFYRHGLAARVRTLAFSGVLTGAAICVEPWLAVLAGALLIVALANLPRNRDVGMGWKRKAVNVLVHVAAASVVALPYPLASAFIRFRHDGLSAAASVFLPSRLTAPVSLDGFPTVYAPFISPLFLLSLVFAPLFFRRRSPLRPFALVTFSVAGVLLALWPFCGAAGLAVAYPMVAITGGVAWSRFGARRGRAVVTTVAAVASILLTAFSLGPVGDDDGMDAFDRLAKLIEERESRRLEVVRARVIEGDGAVAVEPGDRWYAAYLLKRQVPRLRLAPLRDWGRIDQVEMDGVVEGAVRLSYLVFILPAGEEREANSVFERLTVERVGGGGIDRVAGRERLGAFVLVARVGWGAERVVELWGVGR